jgi:hypothetical protein
MKINDAYLLFVNQVNRNLTNNNISVDKPRFILLYNDIRNRYIEWILEKRNEDAIRYISPLLTLDQPLSKTSSSDRHDDFGLPEDYFDLSNLSVVASNSKCKNITLKTWEVKNDDLEEIYNDEFNEPTIEWTETFYTTADGKAAVYKKDFDIDKVKLSYYRYPKPVDISGYTNSEGNPSQDVHPELDDKVVGRIIVAMAKEFSAINNDTTGYQLNGDKLFSAI